MKKIILPYSKKRGELNAGAMVNPDAVLEISENGRYDVARYGYADVNVESGSSDLSTAQMTIHNNSNNSATVNCAMTKTSLSTEMSGVGVSVDANETITVTILLYKGKALITSDHMMSNSSGNITIEPLDAIATGDCSITLIEGIS